MMQLWNSCIRTFTAHSETSYGFLSVTFYPCHLKISGILHPERETMTMLLKNSRQRQFNNTEETTTNKYRPIYSILRKLSRLTVWLSYAYIPSQLLNRNDRASQNLIRKYATGCHSNICSKSMRFMMEYFCFVACKTKWPRPCENVHSAFGLTAVITFYLQHLLIPLQCNSSMNHYRDTWKSRIASKPECSVVC